MADRLTLPFVLAEGDQRLTSLEKRNLVLLFGMAVVSCLLFNFRDSIADIIDSRDICGDQIVRNVSKILLPKLDTHCEQISLVRSSNQNAESLVATKFTHFYGRHDILVILDVWIAITFISQFLLHYRGNILIAQSRSNDIYLFWKRHAIRCLFIVSTNCFMFLGLITLIFFWYPTGSFDYLPRDWEPVSLFSWVDMVSDYGIGAFIGTLVPHVLVLTRTPFIFLHVVVSHSAKP